MSSEKQNVVYIPGLSNYSRAEDQATRAWRVFGLDVMLRPFNWGDGRPFSEKIDELKDDVSFVAKTGSVALVGVSAGASVAIHSFNQDPDSINAVVSICGKMRNPHTLGSDRLRQNPDFAEALATLPAALEELDDANRQKILSVKPLYDEVVPIADMAIDGAQEKTIPMAYHAPSIGYAITLGTPAISRFIKS